MSTQTYPSRSGEQLIDALSTHWAKYIVPIGITTILVAVSLLLFVVAAVSGTTSPLLTQMSFVVGLAVLLVCHHWFFHKIMSESLVEIILTNQRLVFLEEKLLISDDMHEVTLERIRAVEAQKHGLLENIFNYGRLWFDTGGGSLESSKTIPLVPNPHKYANRITQLMKLR